MQRVGTKGPAAEVTRALIFRMAPSLLSPEMLGELMEHAGESEEGKQRTEGGRCHDRTCICTLATYL